MFIGAVEAEGKNQKMAMNFQVCEVKKALAAVVKICRAGNLVQFGSEEEECYIKNKESGKKATLRKKGGSYVMDVEFIREEDGTRMCVAEITVDSGAEESVCPVGWAGVRDEGGRRWNEDEIGECRGGVMRHVGSRKVTFKSSSF